MLIRATIIMVTMLVAFVAIEGQTKRSSKGRKPSVIRETVTVKGNLSAGDPRVKETDADIWRTLTFPDHKLTIEIPARANDEMSMDEPDAEGLWSLASDTENATYRIVIRRLEGILDGKAAADVLDNSIAAVYGKGPRTSNTKIRELNYKGRPGRELFTIEKGKAQIFRVFIVEQRMYALLVTVNRGDRWPTMEIWARRFLDSLRIEVAIEGEA